MKKNILLISGFLLFIIGMTALFLGLSGVIFSFLKFIEIGGPVYAVAIKIFMIFAGGVLAYMGYMVDKEDANMEDVENV